MKPFKHCFPNLHLYLSRDVLFGCICFPDGGCIVYPGWGDAVQERKCLVRLHEWMQKETKMLFGYLHERMQPLWPVRLTCESATLILHPLARPGSEARFECILPVCIHSCKSCSTCGQPNILLGKFYMAPCVQAGRSRAPFVSPCLQWWAISKLPHTLISLGGCFDATSTALHNWQNAIHGQQCFAAPPLCRPSSQGNSKTNKSTSEAGKPVLKYESHRSCFADVVNWFQVIFQLPAT